MRFIKSLGVIVHTLIYLVIGGALLALALNLFSSEEVINTYTNYIAKLVLLSHHPTRFAVSDDLSANLSLNLSL